MPQSLASVRTLTDSVSLSGKTHRLNATDSTTRVGSIDPSLLPALVVESGDEVDIETLTSFGGQVNPETSLEALHDMMRSLPPATGPHTLTGPIRITGAKPGMTLRVDVIDVLPSVHGYNAILPSGPGLLESRKGHLRHVHHNLSEMTVEYAQDIEIPLRPFFGFMGVTPQETVPINSVQPGTHGGNIDLAALTKGASLYLPVFVPGAMFYVGDGHSLQGDGEVCGTAIETAIDKSLLRFVLLEDPLIGGPIAETEETWITLGFDRDFVVAARKAVEGMVALLALIGAVEPEDAYGLCSIAGNLHATQLVNGVLGAHMSLNKAYIRLPRTELSERISAQT